MSDAPRVITVEEGVARISWSADLAADWQRAIGGVRAQVDAALADHERVEAKVGADDVDGQRLATWSGLRREGVERHRDGDRVVYARLSDDPPLDQPGGFRALLNSFLPRKRAIGQMLVRDAASPAEAPRVLLCQLTYKSDWDLPGGVVEVDESPRVAVSRELEEELGLRIPAGPLLLTDWLPPWGGWDDAVGLVFDGGLLTAPELAGAVLERREIRSAAFCTLDEVEARAADFTARRVRAALAALDGGPRYTESGR